ncbi:citrate synthase [Camelliibacillus cellulosilyticus]|uniref:Citrate synthase n=1 Tax=Camelliibacillus cellulosilyticus TaxID=2174486 RepID=A0ABV9GNL3_9BACL
MKGLENVIAAETALCDIDGENGRLIIRGWPIEQLAKGRTFEEAVFFLWEDRFPDEKEKVAFSKKLLDAMRLNTDFRRFLDAIAVQDTVSYLSAALSGLDRNAFSWPPTTDQAVRLVGLVPAIIGYLEGRRCGRPFVAPDPTLSFAGNYLYLLLGERPTPEEVRALDTYFILTMEHGLNASTFTARVIISTQSDLVSAIVGAIGALKGPLHGGAPSKVIDMFEAIGDEGSIEAWIDEQLAQRKRIMGFGHRVYRAKDPRAKVLKMMAEPLAGDGGWFSLALKVEEIAEQKLALYKPDRPLRTNVEFYAAAVFKAIGLAPSTYTATFATSRLAGWCAHALEQAAENKLIRPRAKYIGK